MLRNLLPGGMREKRVCGGCLESSKACGFVDAVCGVDAEEYDIFLILIIRSLIVSSLKLFPI